MSWSSARKFWVQETFLGLQTRMILIYLIEVVKVFEGLWTFLKWRDFLKKAIDQEFYKICINMRFVYQNYLIKNLIFPFKQHP